MRVSELQILAKAHYKMRTITIPVLLAQWHYEMPSEVMRILDRSGLTPDDFNRSLQPLLSQYRPHDLDIIEDASFENDGLPLEMHELLRYILDDEKYDLVKHWRRQNVDLPMMRANIYEWQMSLKYRASQKHTAEASLMDIGRNLTQMAREGQFNHLHPDDETVSAIKHILQRREKGNVILTGPAGIGKTAAVQLLAKQMADDRREQFTIIEIFTYQLISDTKYRGEFEAKLNRVFEAAAALQPVVLFIDEIHTIMGAGRTENGSQDLANLLKPLLTDRRFKMIGATTTEEYQRYITKDPALERRFQELRLKAPSGMRMFQIAKTYARTLTDFHGVAIDDSIIVTAIEKANRFMTNRQQPDKTHDLLDSACVYAKNSQYTALSESMIDKVLSEMVKIPKWMIADTPMFSAEQLSNALKSTIIGQDAIIDRVSERLYRRFCTSSRRDSPRAVFLFTGRTGVGKTQLGKAIAKQLTGCEDHMLQIDLSAYKDYAAINTLIGSPPGYSGSDREGLLTGAIASNPFTVLILDEIEKASVEIMRMLLPLLDTGRLRDARGKLIDATNTVIILTTNAVTEGDFNRRNIGFQTAAVSQSRAMTNVYQKLSACFSSEFLSRIDDVLVFSDLEAADYERIVRQHLRETAAVAAKESVLAELNETVLCREILKVFYSQPDRQVRILKRLIDQTVWTYRHQLKEVACQ
ncbi:MAG: ATP-dependent Clp protease ATP-binding subunit ClpC [Clostridiales bacterium]|jgi:ATP-dependent Clp protease ATP-binding subunit ClpA|nr:ATP-dependent Clp protease ATP-binding subunit ClpC [Clostridiales bacterium]